MSLQRRPSFMLPAPSVRRDIGVLSPRRPVAEEKSPLIACPGCQRPTRPPMCRGCKAKGGRACEAVNRRLAKETAR